MLGTSFLHNRKPYPVYRTGPLSLSLTDLWRGFQGRDICTVEHRKTARVKDKITISQPE